MIAVSMCGVLIVPGAETSPPPVPYLNADGSKPQGMENRLVFIDPQSGDAVVIYPENGDADAVRKLVRVNITLVRHVEPSVGTKITFDEKNRQFSYNYLLSNGAGARQRASRWFFDDVSDSERIRVTAGSQW